MAGLKLGEILVKQGLIKADQMAKALEEQKKTNQKLSQILIQQNLIKDVDILKALEAHFQVPGIDLNSFTIQANAIALVSKEICEKYQLVPVQKAGANTLVVAFADPANIFVRDDLRF
jgi:type IV pilus assembly protein PilB